MFTVVGIGVACVLTLHFILTGTSEVVWQTLMASAFPYICFLYP